MPKLVKIKAADVERMIGEGYCRVSRRHLILARIDREDWREHMARQHAPWNWKGDGMSWATGNGMDDHYRRCYSTDKLAIDPSCQALFMKFPSSGGGYRGAEKFLPKRQIRRVSKAVADAATARGTIIPVDRLPEGHVQKWPDGTPYPVDHLPGRDPAFTPEVEPDQRYTPMQALAMKVMTTAGVVVACWGIVEILRRLS